MACGVGIQFLAERFPENPVFPAVDTTGLAVNQAVGWYEERCRSCGSCVLGLTGGICPVTMCAKGLVQRTLRRDQPGQLRNQPGSTLRLVRIYERLSTQGRLDNIMENSAPSDWQDTGAADADSAGLQKAREGRK